MGMFGGKLGGVGGQEEEEEYDEEREENYFKRLPGDLIVSHVLDKICDAKSLIALSMASKEWSTLVYQTKARTVSLKIPRRFVSERDIMLAPSSIEGQQWWRSEELDLLLHQFIKFLGKFVPVRSLSIEFDFCCEYTFKNDHPTFKLAWSSRFFGLFFARTVDYLDTGDNDGAGGIIEIEDDSPENEIDALSIEEDLFTDDIIDHIMDYHADFMFSLTTELVKPFRETLENVVVKDTKKQYNLTIRKSDFAHFRSDPDAEFGCEWKNMSARFARMLKLPLSGCALKTVVLYIGGPDSDTSEKDPMILLEKIFGKEDISERLFAEAATAMLKKKPCEGGAGLD